MIGPKTTLTLKRRTNVIDSMGSPTTTWAVKSTIKGMFFAQGGNEVIENEKETVRVSHKFDCDNQTIVPTEKDILVDSDGQIYEILFVGKPQNRHLEIKLVRRTI
jgi:SPP1 family predicted phage head-tail adaptor